MLHTRAVLAGAALVIVVLVAHLYMPSEISALASDVIGSLHGPGFGVVALLMLKLARVDDRPLTPYITAATLAMILAGLAEAAQIPGSREAQLSDLIVDATGIVGFLTAAAVFDRRVRDAIGRVWTVLLSLICIPALVLTLTPTLWQAYALAMRSQVMPQILTFDKAWESTYGKGALADFDLIPAPAGWPKDSGNIALLRSAGQYGLMLHIYPYPDWSGYAGVSFVAATTDGESRRIALGLWGIVPNDGTLPGRYYTTKMVGPDPARYCLSFVDVHKSSTDREFDLTHVYELLIGATKHVTGEELLVDDFRLEKSADDCPPR